MDSNLDLNDIQRHAMRRVREIFFVGIGGVGMSAIAEVLLTLGYRVSGSDLKESAITRRLAEKGARIFLGHRAENLTAASIVVSSSAIDKENPELVAARQRHIPIIHRAEMLAEIMRFRCGIAIAGTHGKTTTTSLTTSVLASLDPSFIIGGILTAAGSNGRLGSGQYLVAEADESDASFLHLQPLLAVVTNIDEDHLENYGGSFQQLKQGFVNFLHNLPFYGLAVLCIDDGGVRDIIDQVARPIKTYGFSIEADLRADNVRQVGLTMHFDLVKGEERFPLVLNMPGKHNVLNALAALAIGEELAIPLETMAAALASFKGVGRRFTSHGQIKHANGTADIFEDYGHHPNEIKAVLEAVKEGFAGRRIVAVFQPHRYTRTRDCLDDFAAVLSQCPALVLTDIYSAGEAEIDGISSKNLAQAIRAHHGVQPIYIGDKNEINGRLRDGLLQDRDVVIYFGAGDIGRYAKEMVDG